METLIAKLLSYYKDYKFYAFNAPFEKRFLEHAIGIKLDIADVMIPAINRLVMKRGKNSLGDICHRMDIPHSEAHSALADALAVYHIVNRLNL